MANQSDQVLPVLAWRALSLLWPFRFFMADTAHSLTCVKSGTSSYTPRLVPYPDYFSFSCATILPTCTTGPYGHLLLVAKAWPWGPELVRNGRFADDRAHRRRSEFIAVSSYRNSRRRTKMPDPCS